MTSFTSQGFALPSWWNGRFASQDTAQSLRELIASGANSISIVATAYTKDRFSSTIVADGRTESTANIATILQAAQRYSNVEVIYKPHFSPQTDDWRGRFAPTDPEAWFQTYRTWIVEQATLAQANQVDVFVLGTEFSSLAISRYQTQWTDIIQAIRAVYQGQLTYSSTLSAALNVPFWDQLDFASVTAYPVSAGSYAVNAAQVMESWYLGVGGEIAPLTQISALQNATGHRVLITEAGYRSIDGAALKPEDYEQNTTVDVQEQQAALQGMLSALSQFSTHTGGLQGIHLWNWETQPSVNFNNSDSGYTVQGKPAYQTATQWFQANTPPTTLQLLDGRWQSDLWLIGKDTAELVLLNQTGQAVLAGGGDDRIALQRGSHWIDGGSGNNTLSLQSSASGSTVFFGTDNDSIGVVWNESGVSLFRHIQAVNGSRYDDTLIGNNQNNLFYTEAGQDNVMLRGGDDEVYLGLGNKMVDGGSGLDKVNYSGVGTAITASGDMRLWQVKHGEFQDVLLQVEHLIGSPYADNIRFGEGAQTLDGGGGRDTLGGGTGADRFEITRAAASGDTATLMDFRAGEDQLALSSKVFIAATQQDWQNISSLTTSSPARYLLDSQTRTLYYDADGSGSAFAAVSVVSFASSSDLPQWADMVWF